jgi:U6 snRNA-associated Sm-like protein LSm8
MSLQGYVNSKLPFSLPSRPMLLAKLTTHSDSRAEKVLVLTSDSRTLVGTLLSCDQMTNLVGPFPYPEISYWDANYEKVLSQTTERIIRPPDDPEPSSEVAHGLYLIRGDNVAVVGQVDEELDDSINWLEVRGAVVGGVKHS